MAPKKKNKKGFRDDAAQLLASLGVKGNLTDLVRRAMVQGWSMDEFASNLIQTKAFRNAFPGLVDWKTGQLKVDFSNGAGFSATGLLQAAGNYNRGYDDFNAVAGRLGMKDVSRRLFAQAVTHDISVDEFGQRLQIIQNLKANPNLLEQYNEQRKFMGLKPMTKGEMMKGIATKSPNFYDPYQAAVLAGQLGFSAADAAAVAQGIDSGLNPNLDLASIANSARQAWGDIGPEAMRAGISLADITILAAGSDPKGIATKLEGLSANRKAQRATPGTYAQQTSTGGLSIYPEEEQASY